MYKDQRHILHHVGHAVEIYPCSPDFISVVLRREGLGTAAVS